MKRFALLGKTLGHSYSPQIHNSLYSKLEIDARYELKEVKETELIDAINSLRNGEYDGYNVTIPYKIEVMKYLDEISEEARVIGAVNTIAKVDGKLIGYNTDYSGFKEELKLNNIDVSNKTIYVFGSGGASKAIVNALNDMGANTIVVSRTKTDNNITYDELALIDNIDGIVNTTPIGMYPNVDDSPVTEDVAKRAKFIVDIIFNPRMTKLMSYNKNSFNGLEMLILQALASEKIWLGDKRIDNKELYKEIGDELNEQFRKNI